MGETLTKICLEYLLTANLDKSFSISVPISLIVKIVNSAHFIGLVRIKCTNIGRARQSGYDNACFIV